ncbi:unnamed protein product [Lathyrus sativus]|nr:unnamed protein product [Lathyrus sativus]
MDINIKINGEIKKVNGKELSYNEFVERYMEKNKPVVLTFISYFTLANLVLLCYINRRNGSTTGNSSRVAQHVSMNIGSIRKIASEMKHSGGLEGNHDCIVDMIKTFEDPRFSKFCMQVGKTYLMINGQSNLFSDFVGASMVDLVDLDILKAHTSSQIYAPEELIKFIDNAIAKLGDFYIE